MATACWTKRKAACFRIFALLDLVKHSAKPSRSSAVAASAVLNGPASRQTVAPALVAAVAAAAVAGPDAGATATGDAAPPLAAMAAALAGRAALSAPAELAAPAGKDEAAVTVRIALRHPAELRPQRSNPALMVRHGLPVGDAERLLEEWVDKRWRY